MARDVWLLIVLSPLLAVQAIWVGLRALRLPDPVGARHGVVGQGPHRRLLVLGDSSALGIGVAEQAQALAPQLAAHLGRDFRIDWILAARNGATTADAASLLAPFEGAGFDAAVVVFGVNDSKNLRRETAWRRDLGAIVARLREQHGVGPIVFSGLPDFDNLSVLPLPLRSVLAMRGRRFDQALRDVAAAHEGCDHVALDLPFQPGDIAEDRFHPGAGAYRLWAQHLSDRVRALL